MPSPTHQPEGRAGSFAEFIGTRRFPALDGLRALSVLLVITAHLSSDAWRPLVGRQGVIVFFVLSGFIITTLLVREQAAAGRVSLRGYYVRRAFRIVPLYALVLGLYALLVLGFGVESEKRPGFEYALPYYLTFTNEIALFGDAFRNEIPFYQSWSLGVEEKFYLLWPLLGYGLLRRGGRAAALGAVTAVVLAIQLVAAPNWTRWYLPILVGCGLALALHDERWFARLRGLGRPLSVAGILASLVVAHALIDRSTRIGDAIYPFLVAGLIVGLVVGRSPVRGSLGSRVAVHVGTRAYGIYLVHILAINVADRLLRPDASFTLATLANYLLVALLAYLMADALHRVAERPLIDLGRRVARRLGATASPPPGTVAATPA